MIRCDPPDSTATRFTLNPSMVAASTMAEVLRTLPMAIKVR
jgi:hypothetical protein